MPELMYARPVRSRLPGTPGASGPDGSAGSAGSAGPDAPGRPTVDAVVDDGLRGAAEQGRICALAAAGQRDLARCAEAYPVLFPAGPFDPALFSMVSLATAFGDPGCDPERLRIANRAALWIFAADWLIDHRASSAAEVDGIVRRCLLVADGTAPGGDDPLGRFLAEIRDELAAAAPADFAAARPAWREEFHRMLSAMAREWHWKTRREAGAGTAPDLDEYLDNADNFGSSFVNVSHWIRTGGPETLDHLPELTRAGRKVQRVLRLVNDLATYERDLRWGDLNALLLGVDRAEVTRRVAGLVAECQESFAGLPYACRAQRGYLARQIGFSTGFYRLTDYWGGS